MGKEGDLWDDSALIRAFDDAVSKYKVMHNMRNSEFNDEEAAERDAGESSNTQSISKPEMPNEVNLLPVNESHSTDSKAPEPVVASSNISMQDAQGDGKGYSYSEVADDYNQLLSQYYELDEQRQKILQQLNQFGTSSYQLSGEGSSSFGQWPSCCLSGHSVPPNQATHPLVACSCCPYGCQSLVVPCSSYSACSACSVGEAYASKPSAGPNPAMAPRNASSMTESDIVKTAMGAAAKAISSINEGKDKEEKTDEEVALNMSPPTDLASVLNAWYSAGFYTGKYLLEQSMAKKQN